MNRRSFFGKAFAVVLGLLGLAAVPAFAQCPTCPQPGLPVRVPADGSVEAWRAGPFVYKNGVLVAAPGFKPAPVPSSVLRYERTDRRPGVRGRLFGRPPCGGCK